MRTKELSTSPGRWKGGLPLGTRVAQWLLGRSDTRLIGHQISPLLLGVLALGLACASQAQTFVQRITYTPTGGASFYDTIEAFMVGDPADAFASPGLGNFSDATPSNWRGTLRDRRQAIAAGIAPGSTAPIALSFDLNILGAARPIVIDLVVWDGGPKNGTIVDMLRLTLDGLGGYESIPLTEARVSWAGVPAKWVRRANISIPSSGKASPYPVSVNVKNLPVRISKVSVELKGLTASRPGDLAFLLVGPGGRTVLLMSDAGGTAPCSNVNLTFDDAAPQSVSATGPLVSGTYKPTIVGTRGAFPKGPPVGIYGSTLSVFNGTSPTGTWSLYVYDDLANASSGNVRFGWTITIQ